MKNDLKKDDLVCLVAYPVTYRFKEIPDHRVFEDCKVERVGRKYLYIGEPNGWEQLKFNKSTLEWTGQPYKWYWVIFKDKQAYEYYTKYHQQLKRLVRLVHNNEPNHVVTTDLDNLNTAIKLLLKPRNNDD